MIGFGAMNHAREVNKQYQAQKQHRRMKFNFTVPTSAFHRKTDKNHSNYAENSQYLIVLRKKLRKRKKTERFIFAFSFLFAFLFAYWAVSGFPV